MGTHSLPHGEAVGQDWHPHESDHEHIRSRTNPKTKQRPSQPKPTRTLHSRSEGSPPAYNP